MEATLWMAAIVIGLIVAGFQMRETVSIIRELLTER
jgi:hypothetical protein